jgi:ABC-type lipoprotein export system ATPase subunit
MFQSLRLQGLMPDTLPEVFGQDSEVWNSDFTIKAGEHVLVSAASGKGKSTLIAILYGLKSNYKGDFFLNGISSRLLGSSDWSQWRSNDISIVFQDLRLFSQLSVADNLRLKGNLCENGLFDLEEAKSMCSELGVLPYWDRPCGTLSYGERQRVAIVRSLIQEAGLVLMDEPFSHLDRDNADKALEIVLRKTTARNAALLITSLGQDYGWKYDRILML